MKNIWCNYLLQAKRTSLSVSTAIELAINTAQHEEVAECLADTGFFQVVDVARTTENSHQTYMLLKMMVCIFTVLMTMIIGLNVCNTISNTIDVRRSEYAVLQSVGMTSERIVSMRFDSMDYEDMTAKDMFPSVCMF